MEKDLKTKAIQSLAASVLSIAMIAQTGVFAFSSASDRVSSSQNSAVVPSKETPE